LALHSNLGKFPFEPLSLANAKSFEIINESEGLPFLSGKVSFENSSMILLSAKSFMCPNKCRGKKNEKRDAKKEISSGKISFA
jgi:hypothetical protein